MSFQSAEHAVQQAVSVIFQHWTALILTVEHQLGGDPRPIQRFLETTVSLATCTSPTYNARQIASYFHEEFDRMQTDVDDGSPEEVAHKIIKIRNAAARGDFSPALEIVQKNQQSDPSNAVSQSIRGKEEHIQPEGHDDNEDQDMEGTEHSASKPKQQLVVDDDGFTQVNRAGRHH